MAQQTAVEWLIWELERCGYFEINDRFPITFEQAKKKEKEQIIDAWMAGDNDGSLEPKLMKGIAEEYYNDMYSQEDKTFKKTPQHKNIGE